MVAIIGHSSDMASVINYNEQKVSQNSAELIHASGFLKDKDRLTYYDKSERFERLNELNDRTKVNMLHISLNFDPSENLTKEQLSAIADRYMELIGFNDQPYLVYQHYDAGHPHIHIVTNAIRADGSRIDMHKIGEKLSEPARQAIEKEFNLIRAEDSKEQQQLYEVKPLDVQKVQYGNTRETKQAMRDVLQMVSKEYKFTSLPEYNAVLRQYNMTADQGGTDSRTYKHRGINYRVLDDQGNKVGVPVKASRFYFKPTLPNLEKKFEKNMELRKADLPGIRQRVDWALKQNPDSLRDFVEELKKENIELVIRQNDQGQVYGLTYIDNKTRTVINGRDLGKDYSAGPILDGFDQGQKISKSQGQAPGQSLPPGKGSDNPAGKMPWPEKGIDPETSSLKIPEIPGINSKSPQLLSELMKYDESFGQSPHELSEDLKKKKRRHL